MMATTHALVGAALAAAIAVVAPEMAFAALIGGVAGGVFPDLDLYRYHRRTLHYPSYYSLTAVLASGIAIVVPSPWTVGGAVFITAAAVHSRMDRYGGGLELRPWEATSTRAVYDHRLAKWRRPRRWVRYDGAPEDFLVASLVAIPPLLIFGGVVQRLILVVLGVSLVYVLVRKQLPALAVILARFVPQPFRTHVPNRYLP